MSTGLGDRLYCSFIVLALRPAKSRIILSVVKLVKGSCLEISLIDASFENFG